MIDLDGFIWRPISRSDRDGISHLIPTPLEYGAKTLCGESIDPFHSNHAAPTPCFKCTRIAKERTQEEAA